jgi:hypothetical protein
MNFVVPPEVEAKNARASRYADLEDGAALAELARRQIPFTRTAAVRGVRTPIRLTGPLHGVTIRSSLPEEERAATPFEILDARLALALSDFAQVLAHHDVVEVVHFTLYRPPDSTSDGGTSEGLFRHPGGLAIDLGALRKRNGTLLVVTRDWPAGIGERTCGRGARRLPSRKGRELQSVACEAADLRLFHAILTPHHDAKHHDHLHLEIKPDTRWFLVR